MFENIDVNLVDWSRAQFALTVIFHWLFIPLTLGLSVLVAIMETHYVRSGNELWKKITRFWMTLFGINFAIGIATGIILEFEFGTNWSKYSWFVGDIFGAPLAIEGILAFFLESTFISIMFFGWKKVNKKVHLASTWLVAAGASISALWILVANAWMENPVGTLLNPATARHEMVNFWKVIVNPIAIDKFFHTLMSGFVLASMFVAAISAWFLIKKREELLAGKSMVLAGVFGLISSLLLAVTGDSSARTISKIEPVKFASFEALYSGKSNAPLTVFGFLKNSREKIGDKNALDFSFSIKIPDLLSVMTSGDRSAYVPGLYDHVMGNSEKGIMSFADKTARGTIARQLLLDYKKAKKAGDTDESVALHEKFVNRDFNENYIKYFGYAFIKAPEDLLPDVRIAFYSFHLMVILGFIFILIYSLILIFHFNNSLLQRRWFLWIIFLSIPLPYLAGILGWVLAEMGRQPWIVQDMMPVSVAASNISLKSVQFTFWLFTFLFVALLVAYISIMLRQIKAGSKHIEN